MFRKGKAQTFLTDASKVLKQTIDTNSVAGNEIMATQIKRVSVEKTWEHDFQRPIFLEN